MQGTDEGVLRHVTVMLLNGVKMDVVCALDTTGRQLYDFVVSHLSLPEPVFFGLTFLCGKLYVCYYRQHCAQRKSAGI